MNLSTSDGNSLKIRKTRKVNFTEHRIYPIHRRVRSPTRIAPEARDWAPCTSLCSREQFPSEILNRRWTRPRLSTALCADRATDVWPGVTGLERLARSSRAKLSRVDCTTWDEGGCVTVSNWARRFFVNETHWCPTGVDLSSWLASDTGVWTPCRLIGAVQWAVDFASGKFACLWLVNISS